MNNIISIFTVFLFLMSCSTTTKLNDQEQSPCKNADEKFYSLLEEGRYIDATNFFFKLPGSGPSHEPIKIENTEILDAVEKKVKNKIYNGGVHQIERQKKLYPTKNYTQSYAILHTQRHPLMVQIMYNENEMKEDKCTYKASFGALLTNVPIPQELYRVTTNEQDEKRTANAIKKVNDAFKPGTTSIYSKKWIGNDVLRMDAVYYIKGAPVRFYAWLFYFYDGDKMIALNQVEASFGSELFAYD